MGIVQESAWPLSAFALGICGGRSTRPNYRRMVINQTMERKWKREREEGKREGGKEGEQGVEFTFAWYTLRNADQQIPYPVNLHKMCKE